MKTLPDHERRASVVTAVETLFAVSPSDAAALAEEMGMASLVRQRFKASRD
jgi:hypothetical protein